MVAKIGKLFPAVGILCLLVVTGCIVAVTCSIVSLGKDVHNYMWRLNDTTARLEGQAYYTFGRLNGVLVDSRRTVEIVGGVAGTVRDAAKKVNAQTEAQMKSLDDSGAQTVAAIQDIRRFVTRTDANLNGLVLPNANLAVTNVGRSSELALNELAESSRALNVRISDPAITETMLHTASMSKNLDDFTKSGANSMKAIEHKITAPVSTLQKIGTWGLKIATVGLLAVH